jgi:restriction system protein
MIPNYQQCMRPLLEIVQQGNGSEVSLSHVYEQIAERFSLTEEERERTLPSGKQTVLHNRVGWSRTYLTKTKLLEAPRRGHFTITQRGMDAIADANTIVDVNYLKQFDEYNDFVGTSKSISKDASINTNDEDDKQVTPDEALRNAYQTINDALADDILEKTRCVTPAFFEDLLIELLVAMGYGGAGSGAAHALGKSGDNGVDGVIDQDPLGVDQIYIQAKRYAHGNTVGSGDIRDFFGALSLKRANKGIFITTSEFTASARDTAQGLGTRIVLINGKELAKLMLKYNIGSRDEQVLYLKKIDEEYFET